MADPFFEAKLLLKELTDRGYAAYIVGGAIRDHLLGKPIHDIDIATSAVPKEVMAVFPKTFPVGIRHGTVLVRFKHKDYEVTTFRSESTYGDFRHPDHVTFETTIEADLARRDFTINAMAMDLNGDIFDPYDGKKDLQKKRLRTVGRPSERFIEDPLRMLRAVRFVAELDLTVSENLKAALKAKAPYVHHLAIERVNQEFHKLLAAPHFDKGFLLFGESGLAKYLPFLKGFRALHLTQIRFDRLQSDEERWTAFLLAMAMTDPKAFLTAWKFSKQQRDRILTLIQAVKDFTDKLWDRLAVYRLGVKRALAAERVIVALGCISESREPLIHTLASECPISERRELAVDGNDLMDWLDKSGGPWTGAAINKIEKAVVRGELENSREAIGKWVKTCLGQKMRF
ncbi:CCA tRNA nucleotidyltransferase [Camelliibacillus cellulosilyticus]|uniref:CCA-adding enzyme n=1 Tax=Camelliibacillus cellulosilyticus TaxID=2174486 RepID=A0ABV9GKK6_9BACL